MVRIATLALSNFCRGKNPLPDWSLIRQILPTLAVLLHSTDEEVLADACTAVSYLSDGGENKIQAMIESGVAKRLVELLLHSSVSVQTPALRSVSNILSGTEEQTQTIIDAGCLTAFFHLIKSPKNQLRRDAFWMISNITSGSTARIQAVIDNKLVLPLIEGLKGDNFRIHKEAAWAISNAASGGTREQIMYLVEQGSIKPLCDLLDSHDIRIIELVLDALGNMLKAGKDSTSNDNNPVVSLIKEAGGPNKIENLREHENENINRKVDSIMVDYFQVD